MEKKKTIQPKKPSTTTKKVKSKSEPQVNVDNTLHAKIANLETAYMNAISGKIKFGEVKSIFKKLHKEIKATTKK